MKSIRIFTSLIMASLLILGQVSAAFAAAPLQGTTIIAGEVIAISVQPDINTGINMVFVTLRNNGVDQTVRISEKDAADLGLVYYEDAGPIPDDSWLGYWLEIDSTLVIPDPVVQAPEEPQHPVGSALATFFGLEYDVVMEAHDAGSGFGVIAQALWLSQKVAGEEASAEDATTLFLAILAAKTDGTYEAFYSEYLPDEETIPSSWGQFRKALLAGDKKLNLGVVMSQKDKDNDPADTGNGDNNGNTTNGNSNKDKNKDKPNDGGSGTDKGKGNDKKP
jgi:hypothetical protein